MIRVVKLTTGKHKGKWAVKSGKTTKSRHLKKGTANAKAKALRAKRK